MTSVEIRFDQVRGCGTRKAGGLYLVADGPSASCGRLPLPLPVCGTCGHGFKPTRGWPWVTVPAAFLESESQACAESHCARCPLCPTRPEVRVGLLWCGEAFYATPADWLREAAAQGISRRIATVPKGFVVGETWVLMAHRKALMGVADGGEVTYQAGIFHTFRPTAIEYVVTGIETEEDLAALRKRGITPVRVEQAQQQQALLTV
jgi:hypothetical protein